MYESMLVRLFQGLGNLLRYLEGLLNRNRPSLDTLGQGLAIDQLHYESAFAP